METDSGLDAQDTETSLETGLEDSAIDRHKSSDESIADSEASEGKDWAFAAYRNEKEKRQKLEHELRAFKTVSDGQSEGIEASGFRPPDAIEPQSAFQFQERVAEARMGRDTLHQADQWFSSLPAQHQHVFLQNVSGHPDPFGQLIATYERLVSQGAQEVPVSEHTRNQTPPNSPRPKPAPDLPASLARVRSSGSRMRPEWGGPKGLNDILG